MNKQKSMLREGEKEFWEKVQLKLNDDERIYIYIYIYAKLSYHHVCVVIPNIMYNSKASSVLDTQTNTWKQLQQYLQRKGNYTTSSFNHLSIAESVLEPFFLISIFSMKFRYSDRFHELQAESSDLKLLQVIYCIALLLLPRKVPSRLDLFFPCLGCRMHSSSVCYILFCNSN